MLPGYTEGAMATETHVRAMRPGALHAVPGGLWAIDNEMPVLAFLDGSALQATVIDDWFGKPAFREWAPRRPACTALTGDDSRCWVASPDAGGVFCSPPLGKLFSSYLPPCAPLLPLGKAAGPCSICLIPRFAHGAPTLAS